MSRKQLITCATVTALALVFSNSSRAQWIPTNGPGGGPSVTSLAIHNGKVFAGVGSSVGKDVFVSENGGRTWAPVTTVSGYAVTTLISLKPYLFAVPCGGLVRSSDNGATWTVVGAGVVGTITCITSDADTLYAGSCLDNSYVLPATGSVYRSTDYGQTWATVNRGLPNVPFYVIYSAPHIVLAQASNDSGVFRSTDGGANWVRVGAGLPPVQSFWSIGPTLLAATYENGVYRSLDGGATWQPSNTGLKSDTANRYVSNGFANLGESVYFLGSGLFRSQDSGATWTNVDSNFTENVLSFSATDSEFIAGCSLGIFLSHDRGASWSMSVTGLPNGGVGGMTVVDSALFTAGFYRTTDNGSNWVLDDSDITSGRVGVIFTNGGRALISDGEIVRSPIPGRSLAVIDTTMPGTVERPTYGSGDVAGIVTFGDTILAAVAYGVYRSVDSGVTWVGVNNGLGVHGMGPLLRRGSDLLLGVGYSGIYRSSNGGDSWQPSNAGIDTDKDDFFYFIVAGEHNLFASTGYSDGEYVNADYISRDDGHTWSHINVNLPGFTDFGTGIFTIGNGRIFLNSNLGLLYSSDDGETWVTASGLPDYSLPHTTVTSLAVLGKNLFAGTDSWGVWYRPLSDFGIESAVASLPTTSVRVQCYPNPVSQSTAISFTPEGGGYADVSIVNLLGGEVARIFSGVLDASEHTFRWNPAAMPNGMYECLIRMNGRVEKLRVMLER
ncbi:MAG: hypothetical protein Q8922_09700 [Bacteroidota bacterium]|nr:hypothetical protein [Bacteroidota bacterium]MDP4234466.1 hypothetical protein [Bacteroidota bacterium]MDP4243952.1 hypothetical protein [Bacteroidota bacterium]MDP4288198.1 hypothetical protein [Bacteroidota bacterium]